LEAPYPATSNVPESWIYASIEFMTKSAGTPILDLIHHFHKSKIPGRTGRDFEIFPRQGKQLQKQKRRTGGYILNRLDKNTHRATGQSLG
jgi:hypothetical protein